MTTNDTPSGCGPCVGDPTHMAERLAALAREARLLEFAVDGASDGAQRLGRRLETALEEAMDADAADQLSLAAESIERVLGEILGQGMRLSAEMRDMEIDGVLGRSRMPVLTAVLSASTA